MILAARITVAVIVAAAIANADVVVTSDIGIRCVVAPCPTNTMTWKGRTDGSGHVAVPTAAVRYKTRLQPK